MLLHCPTVVLVPFYALWPLLELRVATLAAGISSDEERSIKSRAVRLSWAKHGRDLKRLELSY